jgi:phosphoribosylanthranilate isomerase
MRRQQTYDESMFRIKICGVTNVNDARAAVAAGADALGFNFYRASKRFVGLEDARQIAGVVPNSVTKVGVFVDHSAREIQEAIEFLRPDFIQLHGDEPEEFLVDLPAPLKIIRAFRCGPDGLAPLASYLDACRSLGRMPDAVLLDSDAAGSFGGTGRAADWSLIAQQRSSLGDVPLVLAGGLTPANVIAAIVAVSPNAVDVASGVERQPALKDRELMSQFVAAARVGFDRV